jgi:hypothetical protein
MLNKRFCDSFVALKDKFCDLIIIYDEMMMLVDSDCTISLIRNNDAISQMLTKATGIKADQYPFEVTGGLDIGKRQINPTLTNRWG